MIRGDDDQPFVLIRRERHLRKAEIITGHEGNPARVRGMRVRDHLGAAPFAWLAGAKGADAVAIAVRFEREMRDAVRVRIGVRPISESVPEIDVSADSRRRKIRGERTRLIRAAAVQDLPAKELPCEIRRVARFRRGIRYNSG